MPAWKKLSQEERRVGYKTVTAKQFLLPDRKQSEFTTWGKTGTNNVAVIALTPDKQIVIARQYRPGPEMVFDELPGGGVDDGEDIAKAAARELLEETGYATDEPFIYLGPAYRDAYANETSHYFLARNCRQQTVQKLDDTEFVEVITITIEELLDNAVGARMSDSVAVLMAYKTLKEMNDA